jgi:hypothetical protein
MGSAVLHFVLTAISFNDEVLVTFQVIGLLYLFPLASVDIYVRDDMWFTRQHYLFLTMLKESGYIRYDRYDPTTFSLLHKNHGTGRSSGHKSFVRIKNLKDLQSEVDVVLSDTTLESASLPTESGAKRGGRSETRGRTQLNSLRQSTLLPSWEEGLLVFLPRKMIPTSAFVLFQTVNDNLQFPDDTDRPHGSGAATPSDQEASHLLFSHRARAEDEAIRSDCFGAMFSPFVSVRHFAQVYESLTSHYKLNTFRSDTTWKGGDRSSAGSGEWTSVCDLLAKPSAESSRSSPLSSSTEDGRKHADMRDHGTTSVPDTSFVDSVVTTVSWQRIRKMTSDTSGFDELMMQSCN